MLLDLVPIYRTSLGSAYVVDSLKALALMPGNSVDLVVTSPPFALQRQKTYGNVDENDYVEWLKPFATQVLRVLRDEGSFVLDLGGAYQLGTPARSLYNFRVLLSLVDEIGFTLAEDFYWYNPSKLPSPIEWVNKRKIRAKDAVNTIWWFGKTNWPKADITKVLNPYSERMKKLLEDPAGFYTPGKRPSGHDIGSGFGRDNGGSIPANLLTIPNTDSNSAYLRLCKAFGIPRHPARFPEALPRFFINMLTDPGDLVVDIFAGSNTTGSVAEDLDRRWYSFESSHDYLVSSVFRFVNGQSHDEIERIIDLLQNEQAAFELKYRF